MPKPARPKPVAAKKPHVILDVEFEEGQLYFLLANIGEGCAHEVVTKFDRPVAGIGGSREMNSLGVFTRLAFMPPGKRIRVFLDAAGSYFRRDEPRQIAVAIHYRDDAKKKHVTRLAHDLAAYEDLGYIQEPRSLSE